MTALATAADMIARYDSRTLGDLCSDTTDRVPEASLANNEKMIAALASATGRVRSALRQGGRYTTDDLDTLTAESSDHMATIVCAIAFANLWRRKPYDRESQSDRAEIMEEAENYLKELKSGADVFEVDAVISATLPQIETVTRVQALDHNLIVDHARAGKFYPRRRTYRNR